MKLSSLAITAAFIASVAAPAFAQTPATPAPAVTAAPAAAAPAAKAAAKPAAQRTAKSLDCSKQADAKNLHGKARKKFRDACKKG